MLAVGSTLLIPSGPNRDPNRKHLHIVIAESRRAPRQLLIVGVSSWHEKADATCRLRPSDHPFIQHDSYVHYRHADVRRADDLERGIAAGALVEREPVDAALLRAIADGFGASMFVKPYTREFLEENKP